MADRNLRAGAPGQGAHRHGMRSPPRPPGANAPQSQDGGAPTPTAVQLQPLLRVMRLYKPRLNFNPAVPYSAQADLLRNGVSTSVDSSLAPVFLRQSDFSLTPSLVLPDSFGSIYRGETFCAYVAVLNHLDVPLHDVKVGARLTAPVSKRSLELGDSRRERNGDAAFPGMKSESSQPNPAVTNTLSPKEKVDMVVQTPLGEVGEYTLRVTVDFRDPSMDSQQPVRTLRKFYRFGVEPAIDVKSVAKTIDDRIFAQVVVKNITSTVSLFVPEVKFVPADGFTAHEDTPSRLTALSAPCDDDDGLLDPVRDYDKQLHLQPGEEESFLFRVEPLRGERPSMASPSGATAVGIVHVEWRTAMGETGILKCAPITLTAPPKPRVALTLSKLPASIVVGRPFTARVSVRNNTEGPLELQLKWHMAQSAGVIVCGKVQYDLGLVGPGEAGQYVGEVDLLPVLPGLYTLAGVTAVDLVNGQEFQLGKVADLFVEESEYSMEEVRDLLDIGTEEVKSFMHDTDAFSHSNPMDPLIDLSEEIPASPENRASLAALFPAAEPSVVSATEASDEILGPESPLVDADVMLTPAAEPTVESPVPDPAPALNSVETPQDDDDDDEVGDAGAEGELVEPESTLEGEQQQVPPPEELAAVRTSPDSAVTSGPSSTLDAVNIQNASDERDHADKQRLAEQETTSTTVMNATEPLTNDAEPLTNDAEPSTNDAEPLTNDAEPSTNDAEPLTNDAEPSTNATEPLTNDAEPSTNATEPSAGADQTGTVPPVDEQAAEEVELPSNQSDAPSSDEPSNVNESDEESDEDPEASKSNEPAQTYAAADHLFSPEAPTTETLPEAQQGAAPKKKNKKKKKKRAQS